MARADYVSETKILQDVVSSPRCRFQWTRHALEQMADPDRDASQPDVENALMNGQVVLIETHKKDILWRIAGSDIDGRGLTVVVAVFESELKIRVVTVWR